MTQPPTPSLARPSPCRWPLALAALWLAGLCPSLATAAFRVSEVAVCSPMMGFCDQRSGQEGPVAAERHVKQDIGGVQRSLAGHAAAQTDYGRIATQLGVKIRGEGLQFVIGLTGQSSGRFSDLISVESDTLPVGTPVQITVAHRLDAVTRESGVELLPSGSLVGGDMRLASILSLALYRGDQLVHFEEKVWCTEGSSGLPPLECTDTIGDREGVRARLVLQAQVGDHLSLSSELLAAAYAYQETAEDPPAPVVLKASAAIEGPSREAISQLKLKATQAGVRLVGDSGKRW